MDGTAPRTLLPVAAPLKAFFDASVARRIAAEIARVHPAFPGARFVRDATAGLASLELMDRGRHLAACLRRHLPDDVERAMDLLVASLGPPLPVDASAGLAPFAYLPHTMLVAEHGLPCFEASMRALHALTQRFTAEFAIRPFLGRHEAATLARLHAWTDDPSAHVRRLVSEGTRPRLPWAPRLERFVADPTPCLPLLERLRDDPTAYVRRSVANHWNDIGKDHPALLVSTARAWAKGAPPPRRALLAHALRSLVKRGDPGALAVLGVSARRRPDLVSVAARPRAPVVGGRVRLEAVVRNPGRKALPAIVDFAVAFARPGGASRPKVFKGKALTLAPGATQAVGVWLSLAPQSTRTHHPGRHRVEVLVNGTRRPGPSFTLRAVP